MSCNDWKEVKLGDVCDTISQTYKKCKDDVVLVNTSDIFNGKVLNHTFIKNENLRGQFKKSFQKDDILYSEIRPKNRRFAYIDFDAKNYIASTKLMVLRSNESILPSYLYQHLKSESVLIELQAIAESRSGTFPQITFAELSNIPLSLPPLPEQKTIADTLSCLDDKMDLNNKINKNLEAQAQAIFKSWFVDFEPFQDGEFVDSELGRIPKGWKVGTLGEVVKLFDFKRIPLSSRVRENMSKIYPYYGATSLMDYVEAYIFDGLYILLGEDGTVVDANGYPILQYVWGKFWVNNHAHIMKGANGFSEDSLYMLLKNTSIQSIVTGAVQLKINQGNLKAIKILIPDSATISKYNNILKPVFACKRSLFEENQALTALRVTLLPKLMSGEIRVPMEVE